MAFSSFRARVRLRPESAVQFCVSCFAFSALWPAQVLAGGRDYHLIVVRSAVKVIPADIRPLFEQRLSELEERCLEPETVWPKEADTRNREHWRYVHLDLAATATTPEARGAAAESFPRIRSALRSFSEQHDDPQPGELPWAILDQYEALTQAFNTGREEAIVRQAGQLMYFVGLAAQPQSVSRDGAGVLPGNVRSETLSIGDPAYVHQTPAHRMFGELIHRHGTRYTRELTLTPADYQPVSDAPVVVFALLTDSLSRVDTALEIDRLCAMTLGVSDVVALTARADEFYTLLDDHAGALCVERMREAARLAANLVGGAWEAAGEPSLVAIRARTDDPVGVAVGNLKPKDIVGSKNSQVFHSADCKFVKNIAPENLIRFKSVLDARQQGRRQCRVCKPD